MVLFDGATIEGGTVVDVFYHHHVKESRDGRQGSGEVRDLNQLHLQIKTCTALGSYLYLYFLHKCGSSGPVTICDMVDRYYVMLDQYYVTWLISTI